MPRLKLLLLDACVVIGLHELGVWDNLLQLCDVTLTRTVAEDEVSCWDDESGERHYIDQQKFQADVAAGRVNCIDVPLSQIAAFRTKFDPSYLDRLDPGEAESLAFLLSSEEEWLISSSDSIVFKVLGRFALAERGISLEEILQEVGLGRPVQWKYSKEFRLKFTQQGQQDSITGNDLL
jgi:hypothetical protein